MPKITVFSGPQERFRASIKTVSAHVEMVDSAPFNLGSDVALSQYAADLADEAVDLNSAASVGFRLRGAADYLFKLKTLAETPRERPERTNPDALKPTGPYRRP